jgi:hypothetical protein
MQQAPGSPELDAEIDDLGRAAAAAGVQDTDAQSRLWKAVFSLAHWVFIARGELPNVQPMAVLVERTPMLLAFTSAERARESALARGLADSEDAVRLLAVPVGSFVESVPTYLGAGLAGILFNEQQLGFTAPLQNLAAIRAHVTA